MTRLLLSRLTQCLVVLLVMSFVIYALMGLMPGDPVDLMVGANPDVTAADAERLRALQGLDQPILQRYGHWLTAAIAGDLGYSRLYSVPVLDVLLPALWNSARILLLSMSISICIAIPLGALAAYRSRSAFDQAVNLLSLAGISLPQFWLALLLMLLFSVVLGWLPAGGIAAPGASLTEELRYLTLPALSLALAMVGVHFRYVRAAMVDVLRQDYIRTARAKGVGTARLIRTHALPNAMLPIITILGLDLGLVFSGALVTEAVFAWPGMGKLIYDAVMGSDYNLALVALLLSTAFVLLGNLLADLCHTWLDPRLAIAGRPG